MACATIVLLEDHPDSLEMYGLLLRHAGYHVHEAATATAAIALLRKLTPDALVMDVGLPDMNGIELCRRLRHDGRLESMPIIAVTGWTTTGQGSRLVDAPFNELLQKPVPPDVLLAAVARWAPAAGIAVA
jgi:CheY-like chemotaxis protein